MSDRIFVVQVQNIMRDDATGKFLWGRGSMFLTPEDAERDRAYRAHTYGADHVRVVPYVPAAALAAALAAMTAERDAAVRDRNNLLARIHGDGGHYTQQVGVERSVEDAHDAFVALVAERDALREQLATLAAAKLSVVLTNPLAQEPLSPNERDAATKKHRGRG